MKFKSTRNDNAQISFRNAVLSGIAEDGGLFIPNKIPKLPDSFFKNIENISFKKIALRVAKSFIKEINEKDLAKIIRRSIGFPIPLVNLSKNISVLELFHGPTLSFKDVGARFLSNSLIYFLKGIKKEVLILVATSGDTGSAVANSFYKMDGVKVALLYPRGGVSKIQEQQLTTFGKNIFAFEVDGTFDDCQRLVKTAFLDEQLKNNFYLTTANSINLARLIPQTFYYFNIYKQIKDKSRPLVVSVPSGNLGNLTAGLIAKKMGLPVKIFISALNSNKVFDSFLKTGKFVPRKTIHTLSNAMDVGSPSNFERIKSIFGDDVVELRNNIIPFSFSDKKTLLAIKEIKEKYNYVADPHGAIGYLSLVKFLKQNKNFQGVFLETAHPAKFVDTVNDAIGGNIKIPKRLSVCLKKKKLSIKTSKDFSKFKKTLIKVIF